MPPQQKVKVSMSKKLQQIQAKARELALSGTFIGWRPIAFTLQFEEGFAEAFDWIYSHATQEELDVLCAEAGTRLHANRSIA
jgi:hypothetical protein